VGFVLDEVALGQGFLHFFSVFPFVLFYRVYTHMYYVGLEWNGGSSSETSFHPIAVNNKKIIKGDISSVSSIPHMPIIVMSK
jgi:hypothetical protein